MTLNEFLSTLGSEKISVNLSDDNGDLISFVSGGYASVESDLLAREVKRWKVDGASAISVILKDAV